MNIHTQISVDQDTIEVDDVHRQVEELEDDQQTYMDEIEELREENENAYDALVDATDNPDLDPPELQEIEAKFHETEKALADAQHHFDQWEQDEGAYLDSLRELAAELIGYDGSILINENHFETYVRDYAESCDLVPDTTTWPFNCIDWTEAAHEFSSSYTTIEWENTTFYID